MLHMWHPQNPLQSSISSSFVSSLYREVDDDAVQVSAYMGIAKLSNFHIGNLFSPKFSINRCGDGLVDVLDSPEVQKYASNIKSKVLFKDKIIYQHGALRKVL